ncbi:MAG: Spy/CpxP family protein refolding chaperone [Oceanospirillaceae bacterium]|jgi:Spy/CpxP family protein refolding chaperone
MRIKNIALIAIPAFILATSFSAVQAQEKKSGYGKNNHCQHTDVNEASKKGERGNNPERKLAKLTKKLNLTDDQQSKLKTLFSQQQEIRKAKSAQRTALHQSIRDLDTNAADYSSKLADVKQQAGLAAQGKIDSMMSMRQKMQDILTADQLKKMQDMQSGRGTKGGNYQG